MTAVLDNLSLEHRQLYKHIALTKHSYTHVYYIILRVLILYSMYMYVGLRLNCILSFIAYLGLLLWQGVEYSHSKK